jgi:tripartite motif-containing protein 71
MPQATGAFVSNFTWAWAPNDIAFSGGNLYVLDFYNGQVDQFTTSGTNLGVFGSVGSGPGQLNQPTRIAADAAGNLYVAEFNGGRVQEFTPAGQPLATFGTGVLSGPRGLNVATNGSIYVADGNHNQITRWAP